MDTSGKSARNKRLWSPWRHANFDYFERVLAPLPRSSKLLDLGAGPLQFEEIFTRFEYTGVDFQSYDHVSIVADLTKHIPVADATADIVTLSNVLEHIPNPDHLLSECRRLLRSGGLLAGTVPFLLPIHQAPYDFNRYTHFQLERMLRKAGFQEIEVVPLGSLIDTYDTIERKFFDSLPPSALRYPVRVIVRLQMRIVRLLFKNSSTSMFTQGYGFSAR